MRLGAYAKILNIKAQKKEVEVSIGSAKTLVKFSDLFNQGKIDLGNKIVVNKAQKSTILTVPKTEINIVGKTALEAETELANFIDQAIVCGLEEIKIIHGVGQGVLIKTVRDYLKADKNVLEYRRGKYGEGENGVTIVKLK